MPLQGYRLVLKLRTPKKTNVIKIIAQYFLIEQNLYKSNKKNRIFSIFKNPFERRFIHFNFLYLVKSIAI